VASMARFLSNLLKSRKLFAVAKVECAFDARTFRTQISAPLRRGRWKATNPGPSYVARGPCHA